MSWKSIKKLLSILLVQQWDVELPDKKCINKDVIHYDNGNDEFPFTHFIKKNHGQDKQWRCNEVAEEIE